MFTYPNLLVSFLFSIKSVKVDFESPIPFEKALFKWAAGTAEEIDLVCYAYSTRNPDFYKFKVAFDYMGILVPNWKSLSKAWATYCLLGTQHHFQTPSMDVTLSQFGMFVR
ncbi:hypothetical protein DM860_015982 [Cuscuta australis]|uniref:Uncharacterized protein n=1 Tax=Cuscuta australis TaxID=267555 RepID=A0A328DYN8_9ASTE|nr:hypothetical protein DM860_015982 [Cuscuta australis]